jgi:hypothetical protein
MAAVLATVLLLLPQGPVIEHGGVGCIVADKHPKIEVNVTPAESVKRARLYFRASGTTAWYFVEMKRGPQLFEAVLPKPAKSTTSIDYYVDAVDGQFREARSAEFQPAVVAQGSACPSPLPAAGALASASVAVGAAAGAPALPAGFASAGVAAAGGGLSAGVIAAVVGGGAAVAGAVVVAAKSGGDEDGGSGGGSGSRSAYDVVFAAPGINVSACAGRQLSWCCQEINETQSDGSFNQTWSPMDPNTLRVAGRADTTRFDATLTCVSGAGPTGSINATGSGTTYTGTFSFGTSQGPVTITRR